MFNSLFSLVDACFNCEDMTDRLCDGAQRAIFAYLLRPVFSASRVRHTSDMHSTFAQRPHHVCSASMVDIQSPTAEKLRIGEDKTKKER